MPGWHEATKAARRRGDLVLLGVIQEQHADRCRLFAQWQQFDWPILHDPLNQLGLRVVPRQIAIDQYGIVRRTQLGTQQLQEFLDATFDAPGKPPAKLDPVRADVAKLVKQIADSRSPNTLLECGDALALWSSDDSLDVAISAYRDAVASEPHSATTHFRLGVAYRMRHDSSRRQADDFQHAVNHWGRALELDPNQYIYRRRIEQYGPRLSKPYSFYDWVEQARRDIVQRGQTPVALSVEPSGAEFAIPSRDFRANGDAATAPDPEGRIDRDKNQLVQSSAVVVPASIRPGQSARVHLRLVPSGDAHWNNEAEPLKVWVEAPEGWQVEPSLLSTALPDAAESKEVRTMEFEIQASRNSTGKTVVHGYALYYICQQEGDTCLFLRQDIEIPIQISVDGQNK